MPPHSPGETPATMQIWPYLPRLDADAPSIDAVIKRDPEDFVVEEVAAYEPSGEGDHLFLWIEKRDISAEALGTHLSRTLKVPGRDIGAAGMKDRRAITRQWISVPAAAESSARKSRAIPAVTTILMVKASFIRRWFAWRRNGICATC